MDVSRFGLERTTVAGHPAACRAALAVALSLVAALIWTVPAQSAESAVPDPVLQVFRTLVGVHTTIPETARSAGTLGTNRGGTGIVIDGDGLILTVGYVVLDAASAVVLVPGRGQIPADLVGYYHETGFGLIRARAPLEVAPAILGDSDVLAKGTPVAIASIGERPLTPAYVMHRKPYAGGWEYLLDNAIWTAPAHADFGGAALVDANGAVLGVGSLLVNVSEIGQQPFPGNVFIPINQLKPILKDLVANGRAANRTHPWLGIYTSEQAGRVFVERLATDGPGQQAGVEPGDMIIGVAGKRVGNTEGFLRQMWAEGRAGDPIALDILRPANRTLDITRIVVPSISRYDFLEAANRR